MRYRRAHLTSDVASQVLLSMTPEQYAAARARRGWADEAALANGRTNWRARDCMHVQGMQSGEGGLARL